MTVNWNRLLSGLIALIYIVAGFMKGGAEFGCVVIPLVILPLAVIWFGDGIGDYKGSIMLGSITTPTPDWLVRFGGWLWLLLPVIIWIVYALIIWL